jgi:hypothetical protein
MMGAGCGIFDPVSAGRDYEITIPQMLTEINPASETGIRWCPNFKWRVRR